MRAIVTGSNSGLGLHTAAELAKRGYQVVLAVRSEERGLEAAAKLRSITPRGHIEVATLDLASLESVRNFAHAQSHTRWDLLVNNAGAKIERPFKRTDDGFEWHIGVNHYGHFALTAGLWPARATGARVVTVSSIVASGANLKPANQTERTFDEGRAYADSKLLNLLFAANLARLISEHEVDASSVAAHPGFSRAAPYGTKLTRAAELVLAQPAAMGARSIIEATTGSNDEYFAPRIFQLWGKPKRISMPDPTKDTGLLKRYWAEAEEATNSSFEV